MREDVLLKGRKSYIDTLKHTHTETHTYKHTVCHPDRRAGAGSTHQVGPLAREDKFIKDTHILQAARSPSCYTHSYTHTLVLALSV